MNIARYSIIEVARCANNNHQLSDIWLSSRSHVNACTYVAVCKLSTHYHGSGLWQWLGFDEMETNHLLYNLGELEGSELNSKMLRERFLL